MSIQKRLRGLILAVLTVFVAFVAYAETVTVSTYYPSPYGSYTNLDTTGATNLATAAGDVVMVNGGGRVGIGVAPGRKLQVGPNLHAASDGILLDGILRLAWGAAAGVANPPAGNAYIWHESTDGSVRVRFSNGNVPLTVDDGNNVGIATVAPTAGFALDVAGNVFIRGPGGPAGNTGLRLTNAGQTGILQVICDTPSNTCYASYAP